MEHIELISPLIEVSGIKSKKSASREISFLSVEQTSELINVPDIHSATGFRHRVILTLLYDRGCHVQELCDLTIADIFISEHSTVRLHGKGNKTRTVIISDETAKLIKEYLKRFCKGCLSDHPLITNCYHQKIDRDGIGYILKKYVEQIRTSDPSFPSNVHCHVLRHSKAMHMLEAGINIVYIRDFLGHEDISTTMIYDKGLMEFLNSLK